MSTVDWVTVENDFYTTLNNLRQDPQSFIGHLEDFKKLFKGDILYRPGEIPLQTVEGVSAIDECIEDLTKTKPLEPLKRADELDRAARAHCDDIGPKGLTSHDGTDGSNCSDRIERYCEWEETCAENLDFGSKNGFNCLISLLIDDGVQGRGHRKNLLSNKVRYVGIAGGNHKEYEGCLVVDFVGNYRSKDKPFFDRKTYKYEYPEDLSKKPEPRKIKNIYQRDDEDAPDDCVAVKTVKQTKLYEGKVHRITKKIYTLKDGSTTIVEVQDI